MDFLQEPTFSAFIALLALYLVTKIVSLVVSSSIPGRTDTVTCSVHTELIAEGGAVSEISAKSIVGEDSVAEKVCDHAVDSVDDEVEMLGEIENDEKRVLGGAEIAEKEKEEEEYDDDDWEDVERSELEKPFGDAKDEMMEKLGGELKLSSGAKWNAWQKLGSISQEKAKASEATPDVDNIQDSGQGESQFP